jgi:hypothetical protein
MNATGITGGCTILITGTTTIGMTAKTELTAIGWRSGTKLTATSTA